MEFKLEKWPFANYAFQLPVRYSLWGPADRGVVICLHGYQDHALSMMKRLGWWEKTLPFQVLAINAPFPVPIWAADGFHEAYAWYFRDTDLGFTIASPNQTAERVAELIHHLKLGETTKVLFGFSQGGYLAPFLAPLVTATRAIIGLGSGFPFEAYQAVPKMNVIGIHGEQDERIPIAATRAAHARLLENGFSGEFVAVPNLDHRVSDQVEPLIRARCEAALI